MKWKANALLLLTAAIWGLAFVAQRMGMEHMPPFAFNGVRFALGACSLLPFLYWSRRRRRDAAPCPSARTAAAVGLGAGAILFAAASLQQIGLVYTTAGKAAFITSLYIVLVPLGGLLLRQTVGLHMWLGCLLSLLGLYFLCIREQFALAFGDFLVLAGAFFWTLHILWIDHFAKKMDTILLAFLQFAACSVLSLATAYGWETVTWQAIGQAATPLLYGGIGSVGIAYTLQIAGQKLATPAQASLILSLETVFAAVGGSLLLREALTSWELLGCALMLSGMVATQVPLPVAQESTD